MTVSNLENEINLILGRIRDSNLRMATGKLLVHFVGELKSLQVSIEDLQRELRHLKNRE
ncbi:hypothetical protein [Brucella sp. LJL56]